MTYSILLFFGLIILWTSIEAADEVHCLALTTAIFHWVGDSFPVHFYSNA